MIEIGSWIGLAAITKSELTIENVNWEYLGQIPRFLKKLGIRIEKIDDNILYLNIKMDMKFKVYRWFNFNYR